MAFIWPVTTNLSCCFPKKLCIIMLVASCLWLPENMLLYSIVLGRIPYIINLVLNQSINLSLSESLPGMPEDNSPQKPWCQIWRGYSSKRGAGQVQVDTPEQTDGSSASRLLSQREEAPRCQRRWGCCHGKDFVYQDLLKMLVYFLLFLMLLGSLLVVIYLHSYLFY